MKKKIQFTTLLLGFMVVFVMCLSACSKAEEEKDTAQLIDGLVKEAEKNVEDAKGNEILGNGSFDYVGALKDKETEIQQNNPEVTPDDSKTDDLGFHQLRFETADEAVNYVLSCLEQGRYIDVLNACTILDMAENYDFVKTIDGVGGWSCGFILPNTDAYEPVNAAYQYEQFSRQLRFFLLNLCIDEGEEISSPKEGKELSSIGGGIGLYEHFSSDNLKDFKVLRCDQLDLKKGYEAKGYYENYLNYLKEQKERRGYTDIAEYLTLYEVNGHTFIGGFTCAKYEKGWTILSMQTSNGGVSSLGADLGTEEEYEERLKEWK